MIVRKFLALGAAASVGFPHADEALVRVDDGGHAGRARHVERRVAKPRAETFSLRDGLVHPFDGDVRNPSLPATRDRPQPGNDVSFDLE